MRNPNLAAALAELAATGLVHYIDTATGREYSVTIDEHLALLPVLPDRVRVRMTKTHAPATAAEVRGQIFSRN